MPKAPKSKVGQDKKPIHPNSRKAMVLSRNLSHDKRLQKSKIEKKSKLEVLVEKMKWFQAELLNGIKINTKKDLAELIQKYFQRFDKELEQIRILNGIGNRKGVRHASRESAIRMTLDMEKSEFQGNGLDVPDLTEKENSELLRNWEGQFSFVPKIKMIKISENDLIENESLTASDKTVALEDGEMVPEETRGNQENVDASLVEGDDQVEEEEESDFEMREKT